MKLYYSKLTFLILFFTTNMFGALYTEDNERAFTSQYTSDTYGDMLSIGNTILCKSSIQSTSYKSGVCLQASASESNDNIYTLYTKLASDASDSNIFNSSSSDLTLPTDSKVLWATLYWQGGINSNTIDTTTGDATLVDLTTAMERAKTIRFKTPDTAGTYITLSSEDAKFNWNNNTSTYNYYQGAVDVTQFVKQSGTYQVANLVSNDGDSNGGTGPYGGWNLLIVYQNNTSSLKNITIYDGFKLVTSDFTQSITGFFTPIVNAVNSKLTLFATEADAIRTEDIYLADSSGTLQLVASDELESSIKDSSGASVTTREPNYTNTLGVDIHTWDVGTSDGAKNIITNSQTTTSLSFDYQNDIYNLGNFALSTELYVPQFCYDYAFKQNDTYIHVENDGTQDPMLTGTVTQDEPMEVTIYLKNLVDSNFTIENMFVDILDINTSQLTYSPDTVKRALSGELYPVSNTDTDWPITTSNSYIQDIPIGNQVTNDNFYLYYSLIPQKTDINDTLNIRIKYDLNIGVGDLIPYDVKVGAEVPMCSTSNLNYTPTKGKFVVVHKPTYNNNAKYNLPTQITNRDANFKVLSIDNDFSDDVDNLILSSTMISVELIDVGSFHYTDAACSEQNSSITDKTWLLFPNDTSIDFTLKNSTAKQNVAFRITYNVLNDAEDEMEIVQAETGEDSYSIVDFPDYVTEPCNSQYDGTNNNVADACGNAGVSIASGLTMDEVIDCMQCIFGYRTKFVCSRDNFSIRPEAFSVEFHDKVQGSSVGANRILDSVSGNETPSSEFSHLAAGYEYFLDIKAITHKDENPSLGYTTTYSNSGGSTRLAYDWNPIVIVDCNDTQVKFISPYISSFQIEDGQIGIDTFMPQVGKYKLSMLDTSWTQVDSNPDNMTHHNDDNYLLGSGTPDCVIGSSISQVEGITTYSLNGCDISSQHTATDTGTQYNDYKIEFHPYKFDMTDITPSFGENNSTTWAGKPFIYMSDMTQNEEMSFHLNGQIKPTGYEGTEVFSNFADSCYAYPLRLDIDQTGASGDVAFKYSYHNINDSDLNKTGDLNTTTNTTILLGTNEFKKDQNGTVDTILNLNFARDQKIAVNPETIIYNTYKVKCKNTTDCERQADLYPDGTLRETKEGNVSLSKTLEHYYGRTNGPRQRYNGSEGNASIYFEVYCDGCDKTKLQPSSVFINDPRWLSNTSHTSDYGVVGNVTQKYTSKVTAITQPTTTSPSTTTLSYTGGIYPYKATMENNASRWLIYNKYNATTTKNEFEVEFDNSGSSWSGKKSTESKSNSDGAKNTSRRIMW